MFTSLLPRAHGVRKNGQKLAPLHRRLAEILSENGYVTAAFVSSFVVDGRFGYRQGFATFDDQFRGADSSMKPTDWEGQAAPEFFDRRANETRSRVVEWLRTHGYLDADPPPAPFFVWVHLFDPHDPYAPPDEAKELLAPEPSKDSLAREIANYDAEIRFADREMGVILDALREVGRFEQMITIVVGDHGEGLMQHGHMHHGLTLYEEAVRVPFVFHWPKSLREARAITAPVQILDLAPTVLDLVGLPPDPRFHGTSLAPNMRGEGTASPDRPVFLERRVYETSMEQGFRVAGAKFALRLGGWKYIEARAEGTFELFDLVADPGELHNLFETQRERADELARVLHEWSEGSAADPAPPVSPEDARRLRELGYVQ